MKATYKKKKKILAGDAVPAGAIPKKQKREDDGVSPTGPLQPPHVGGSASRSPAAEPVTDAASPAAQATAQAPAEAV